MTTPQRAAHRSPLYFPERDGYTPAAVGGCLHEYRDVGFVARQHACLLRGRGGGCHHDRIDDGAMAGQARVVEQCPSMAWRRGGQPVNRWWERGAAPL